MCKGVKMFIKLEKIIVNTDLIKSFNEHTIWFVGCENDVSIISLEDYKKLLTAVLPKKKIVKNNEPKSELLELFEKLHSLTGGKGKAIFSLAREKKLSDLLTKHRMTPGLLIKAATNIGNNEFLQGKNDRDTRYGDIDYLLRPDKAAKYAEDQPEKQKRMF